MADNIPIVLFLPELIVLYAPLRKLMYVGLRTESKCFSTGRVLQRGARRELGPPWPLRILQAQSVAEGVGMWLDWSMADLLCIWLIYYAFLQ